MRRRALLRRFFVVFGVIFGAGAVLFLFYFLSTLGPGRVDPNVVTSSREIPENTRALFEASRDAERQFEELLTLREPDDQHVELLKAAVRYQEAYIAALPANDPEARSRLDRIDLRLQNLAGELLYKESLEQENQGDRLEVQRQFAEAEPFFERAAALQRQINNDYPRSSSASRSRETRLNRAARFATVRPIYERSIALEREADEAIEAEDLDTAENALQDALRLQEDINRRFIGSSLASPARLETLRGKLVNIDAGREHARIVTLREDAEARIEANAYIEAAGLYQEAEELQRGLNQRFPGSRYASNDALNALVQAKQTAQSTEIANDIRRQEAALNAALRGRDTAEAQRLLGRLRTDLSTLAESYPRSAHRDESRQLRARYLDLIADSLNAVQEVVYASSIEVPEKNGLLMFRTEVTQSLYEKVMAGNPSRNRGAQLPVDSVSWSEASEFCQRLGWILARPVRLPSEMEYRQALGPLRFLVLEDHAWGSSNSDMATKPVGQLEPHTAGFKDLLGNVSEWLAHEGEGPIVRARHIGGHVQDTFTDLFTVPLRDNPPNERNRLIGFRFVLEPTEGNE